MKKTRYRIGEYRITEYEKGSLWWEAHHGFGVQRSGKCFVHDDILIIGQCIHEEIGYLKGEFLDHLGKLPPWNKTRYYCFAFELLDVPTGRSLKEDVLEQILSSGNINRAGPEADMNEVPRTFRLDKYQITVAANGELSWQAYGGMERIIGGQCIMESDVLFIGSQEYEKEDSSKHEFLTKVKELPQWDRTRIWSRNLVLRDCQPQQQRDRPSATAQDRDTSGDRAYHEESTSAYWNPLVEQFKRLLLAFIKFRKLSWLRLHLPSSFKFRKSSWHLRDRNKVRLIYLIPLILAGLLLGLILSLHSVVERLHWFHSSEEHHHKHKSDRR